MVYELEPEYDRLSMKNLSRGMKGTIAEYYSDWASETTRDRMPYMARVGQRQTGGPIPFGLAVNEDKEYVQDPDWFPTLLEIFRRYAAGDSTRAIARWLTEEGVPPPGLLEYRRKPEDDRGRAKRKPSAAWMRYTVERILRNEAYHGTLVYNRAFGKRHSFRPKDPSEVVRIEGAWTRFVPDELWYSARARDEATDTPVSTVASRSTFALGAVRCRRCGHSMHGYTVSKYKVIQATGERKRYRYRKYRCTGRSNSGSCDAPMIPAERLERLIVEAIARHLREDRKTVEALHREGLRTLEAYQRSLEEGLAAAQERERELAARQAHLVEAYAQAVGQASRVLLEQLAAQVVAAGKKREEAAARVPGLMAARIACLEGLQTPASATLPRGQTSPA